MSERLVSGTKQLKLLLVYISRAYVYNFSGRIVQAVIDLLQQDLQLHMEMCGITVKNLQTV